MVYILKFLMKGQIVFMTVTFLYFLLFLNSMKFEMTHLKNLIPRVVSFFLPDSPLEVLNLTSSVF